MATTELAEFLAEEIGRILREDRQLCLGIETWTVDEDMNRVEHPPKVGIDGRLDCGKLAEALLARVDTSGRSFSSCRASGNLTLGNPVRAEDDGQNK